MRCDDQDVARHERAGERSIAAFLAVAIAGALGPPAVLPEAVGLTGGPR